MDEQTKTKQRRTINLLLIFIVVLVIAVIVVFICVFSKKSESDKTSAENIYTLISITKTNKVKGNEKTVLLINSKGDIEKSTYVDELTKDGAPEPNYSKVGSLSKEDLLQLKELIEALNLKPKVEQKYSNYLSQYDSFTIHYEDSLSAYYYFDQEDIAKIYSIIINYINDYLK